MYVGFADKTKVKLKKDATLIENKHSAHFFFRKI